MTVEIYTVEPCSLPSPKRPEDPSEAQHSLYEKVLSHFRDAYTLPSAGGEGDEASELSPNEKRWLV